MDGEDREKDKKLNILPMREAGAPRSLQRDGVSVDVIKSMYIASGMSPEEISKQTFLPIERINELIGSHNLPELRKAYIIEGVKKIQNVQIQQSHKLMDLENNFKKMRIVQLEKELEESRVDFVKSETKFDHDKKVMITSKIMFFYLADFGGSRGVKEQISFVHNQDFSSYQLKYSNYNWDLKFDNY